MLMYLKARWRIGPGVPSYHFLRFRSSSTPQAQSFMQLLLCSEGSADQRKTGVYVGSFYKRFTLIGMKG